MAVIGYRWGGIKGLSDNLLENLLSVAGEQPKKYITKTILMAISDNQRRG